MPGQIEFLNGGLVTSRDASLLAPGELSVAEDVALLPGSPSIHKAPGRRAFNTTALSPIKGLAYAAFDATPDLLAAAAGGSFYIARAAETNEFSLLTTGAGESLSSATMLNKSVLFAGGSRNIVLLSDGTQRPHGMVPVTASIGYTYVSTGGTWPLGANQLGYFDYWTTEVYRIGDDEVESTFAGTPTTVNVTSVTALVTLYKPPSANSNATHWRVYRSLKKTALLDPAFPVGFLIGELSTSTVTFVDGASTVTAATLPTAYTTSGDGTWTTPEKILTDDGVYAVSPTVDPDAGVGSALITAKSFTLTPGNPVTDITVKIKVKDSLGLYVRLATDGAAIGAVQTPSQTVPTTGATAVEYTLSGLWGRTWLSSELTDAANFRVVCDVLPRVIANRADNTVIPGHASIDYIKVVISHGGTTAAQTDQFSNIQIVTGPSITLVGANGQPPAASTGDVFQGSVVMNDPAAPTNVVWTIPGTLDYSPVPYRLALDTGEHDAVTCIRSLGSICIIGAEGTMHRLNYVPVSEDSEFNVGRAIDVFNSDTGVVGPNAAVRVTVNSQLLLFYISQNSLNMTNGFTVETATDDIIWPDMVNPNLAKRFFVLNNTEKYELLVFYATPGALNINKMLRLSYHSTQLKAGKMKVVGVTNYAAQAGVTGIAMNGARMVYTAGTAGVVYVENRGYVDNSGSGINPFISSREIHANGPGGDWELDRFLIHHQGGGGTIDVALTSSQTNYATQSIDKKPILMTDRMMSMSDNGINGSGIGMTITGRDDGLPMTLDYMVLFSQSLGDTTSLKK